MKNRQKLKLDFESLFPGEFVEIGKQQVNIYPLGIEQFAIIARKLEGVFAAFKTDNITWENFKTPENLFKIAVVLLDKFPEVLEEASNIDIEDLKKLPIDIIVELLDKIIEVNISSVSKLEKNFKSLAEKINKIPMEQNPQ